jgi:hypothetical protein
MPFTRIDCPFVASVSGPLALVFEGTVTEGDQTAFFSSVGIDCTDDIIGQLAVGDFNGDGLPDVIAPGSAKASIRARNVVPLGGVDDHIPATDRTACRRFHARQRFRRRWYV